MTVVPFWKDSWFGERKWGNGNCEQFSFYYKILYAWIVSGLKRWEWCPLFQDTALNLIVFLLMKKLCNDFPQEVLIQYIYHNFEALLIMYQLVLTKEKGLIFDMLFGISSGVLVNV